MKMRTRLFQAKPVLYFESLESRQLLSASMQSPIMGPLQSSSALIQPAAALTKVAISQLSSASVYGESVWLLATVTLQANSNVHPTGTITFKSGKAVLGTVPLTSGKAILVAGALAVGTNYIFAVYNGAAGYASSTSGSLTHPVSQASDATTLTSSASKTVLGQSVTFKAAVSALSPSNGVATGSVTFRDGSTIVGTVPLDSSAHASLQVYNFFTGTHKITASYGGSVSFKPSQSGTISQTVNMPALATAKDGLQSATITPGSGTGAVNHQWLKVDYTGYLLNGVKFDSSLNASRTPFDFALGEQQVIKGWDEGMVGLKVGETRVLVIPSALGYGAAGQGNIPPNSTLVFIVRMIAFDYAHLSLFGGANFSVKITNNEIPSTNAHTDFGKVKVGQTGSTAYFGIAAQGPVPLRPTGSVPVVISGTNPGDFTVDYSNIFSQSVFSITFKPKAAGIRTARITIPTNDVSFPNFSFMVVGIGT